MRAGKARRPCTHNRDHRILLRYPLDAVPLFLIDGPELFGVIARHSNRLHAVLFRDETFQRTDGDRRVDPPPPAGDLAGGAADPAADRGERVRGPCDPIGLFIIARCDGPHVTSRIRIHGTAGLALDILPPVLVIRDDHLKFRFGHGNAQYNQFVRFKTSDNLLYTVYIRIKQVLSHDLFYCNTLQYLIARFMP